MSLLPGEFLFAVSMVDKFKKNRKTILVHILILAILVNPENVWGSFLVLFFQVFHNTPNVPIYQCAVLIFPLPSCPPNAWSLVSQLHLNAYLL